MLALPQDDLRRCVRWMRAASGMSLVLLLLLSPYLVEVELVVCDVLVEAGRIHGVAPEVPALVELHPPSTTITVFQPRHCRAG